jgi:hypothetical protein
MWVGAAHVHSLTSAGLALARGNFGMVFLMAEENTENVD